MSLVPDLAARVREAALLEGDFVLSSGQRSSFYVDKYRFSTDPVLLRDIAASLANRLPQDVTRLAGVELGAVPLVVAASLETGLPYIIARKAAKEYGSSAGSAFEGEFERGERVALIEDVVTTGTQAVAAARRLVEAGAEVAGIIAVLDRREVREASLGEFGFDALLTIEDLRVETGD
ncbi:MAG TPA: orotate phosphoribosyltransferase [Rubrobacteraceae bacterium]|nr:orotate phosphoribosyltransferase [Rubrobacteraceae bacterium]